MISKPLLYAGDIPCVIIQNVLNELDIRTRINSDREINVVYVVWGMSPYATFIKERRSQGGVRQVGHDLLFRKIRMVGNREK